MKKETVQFIIEKTNFKPEIGIVLGSGLGNLTADITIEHEISYESIIKLHPARKERQKKLQKM